MRALLTSTVVATVLVGSMPAEPGLGQARPSNDVDELRERHQDPRRPRTDEEPDARKYKSLTPEERRERTMRRKLRRVDELMEKGNYGEGAALLESLRVSRSAEDFAHVQNTLAFAYSQSNQPEKAIGHYERVLRIPAVPASIGLSAQHQLAQLYYEQGREQIWDEDAEKWFRQALSAMETWMGKSPNKDPKDYLFLSRIQVELNDLSGGIESLETAIRLAEERNLPIEEEWNALLDRMKSASGD
ncbi:MAG: tetratricopeptide repeat protein [Gammaproteobacteria bacterium]|nr:tetratricopeptide repeat protein [Gammaproteobacteria bacterium]